MLDKVHNGSGVSEPDSYWSQRSGGIIISDVRKDGKCVMQRTTDGKGGEPWVKGCCTFDGHGGAAK